MEQILASIIIAIFFIALVLPAIGASTSDGYISYIDALKTGAGIALIVILLGVGGASLMWAFEVLFGG